MHRAKLRWWAFRQFVHCCRLYSAEIVRTVRVYILKRRKRRFRYTFGDLRVIFLEDIRATFWGGHLNQLPFVGMEDDHPEIRTRMAMTTDRLVRIAVEGLERLERSDAAKTGVLPGYAAAQRQHLQDCERCQSFVCGTIIGDIIETREVRNLLRQARDTDGQ